MDPWWALCCFGSLLLVGLFTTCNRALEPLRLVRPRVRPRGQPGEAKSHREFCPSDNAHSVQLCSACRDSGKISFWCRNLGPNGLAGVTLIGVGRAFAQN